MKKYLLFIIVIFAYSCNTTTPNPDNNCFGEYVDTEVYFKVQSPNGKNLLGNEVNTDLIKLYYLSYDGCVIYYYNENAYNSDPANTLAYKGYSIVQNGNDTLLYLALMTAAYHKHGNTDYINPVFKENTIYIEWNENNVDTIYANYLTKKSTLEHSLPNDYCQFDVYDKIYLNGNLIVSSWEDNRAKMSQGIYPTIIK